MKVSKILLIGLLSLVLVFAIVGCSPPKTAEKPAPASAPVEEPKTIEPAITDVVGREVKLDAPAKKLVGTHNPTLNQAVIPNYIISNII